MNQIATAGDNATLRNMFPKTRCCSFASRSLNAATLKSAPNGTSGNPASTPRTPSGTRRCAVAAKKSASASANRTIFSLLLRIVRSIDCQENMLVSAATKWTWGNMRCASATKSKPASVQMIAYESCRRSGMPAITCGRNAIKIHAPTTATAREPARTVLFISPSKLRNTIMKAAHREPFMAGSHNMLLAIGPTLRCSAKKSASPFSAGNVSIRPAAWGKGAARTTRQMYTAVPAATRQSKLTLPAARSCLLCRRHLRCRLLIRLEPRQHLLCEDRQVAQRIFMAQKAGVAHHQKVAHAAAIFAEAHQLVVDLIRRATE